MTEAKNVSLAGKRILIVEDEYWLATEIANALEEDGAEIIGPVGTLRDAQRLLESDRLDCAVLDVNLHGEMAFPIAEQLQGANVPFALASGYDKEILPANLADVPRLRKPFDPRELRGMLPQLIANGQKTG